MAHVKWLFWIDGKDGNSRLTRREEMEMIQASRNDRLQPDLIEPELPDELLYLENIWTDIRKGCEQIDFNNLVSYQTITGTILTRWQCSMLLEIDRLCRGKDRE